MSLSGNRTLHLKTPSLVVMDWPRVGLDHRARHRVLKLFVRLVYHSDRLLDLVRAPLVHAKAIIPGIPVNPPAAVVDWLHVFLIGWPRRRSRPLQKFGVYQLPGELDGFTEL